MALNQELLKGILPPSPYTDRTTVWGRTYGEAIEGGILIVGEAPGRTEDKTGEPFVGKAGKLLRSLLDEFSVTVYHLVNASLWRPAGPGESADKPPSKRDLKLCRAHLLLTVAMYHPKAILAVGAVAAEALLGDKPRKRGMVYEYSALGWSCPLYLTYHPSYVNREPNMYPDLVEDISRIVNGILPDNKPTLILRPGDSGAFEGPVSSLDVEVDSLAPGSGQLLCASLSGEKGISTVLGADQIRGLPTEVKERSLRLVGHNSIADEVMLRMAGHDVRFSEDTLLMHYAMNETKGTHKLKTLAPVVGGVTTYEDQIWPYIKVEESEEEKGFKNVPPEILQAYCGRDADATLRVYRGLRASLDERAETLYDGLLLPARDLLCESILKGILVDQVALEEEIEKQQAVVDSLRDWFKGRNPNSPDDMLELLKQEGYKIEDTREETLRDLEGDVPMRILQYREEDKVLTGFLLPTARLLGADGRIRAWYKLHGTETGRLSCSDPNLQQVPDRLKHLFIASPGCILMGWDYSQLEIRTQAWECQDENMIEILKSGMDYHQYTADAIGLDRQKGKRLNFLIQYGGSANKASYDLGITKKAAQDLIDRYYATYPRMRLWKEGIYKKMYGDGYIDTPFLRRRHFPYITEDNRWKLEREAANFPGQSIATDINLVSAIKVWGETGWPSILLIHDFAGFEVPLEEQARAREIMHTTANRRPGVLEDRGVDFPAEIKSGPTWASMK